MAGIRRFAGMVAALGSAMLLLAGCGMAGMWGEDADTQGLTRPVSVDAPELSWRDCDPGIQCATMTVPADWHAKDGPTTKVNLIKLPALDPQQRAGSVVANFGARNTRRPLPSSITNLRERFDVVVFDARGLGQRDNGTLIDCAQPPASPYGLVLEFSEPNWQALAEQNRRYEQSCRKAAGPAFDGLTSWQVAHDMEALRGALREEKLRYVGGAYGTTYGQAYAELFGNRLRAMYLDGVLDHTQPDLEEWLTNYARTTENQLRRFQEWCDARPECALHGESVLTVWKDLVNSAETAPLPAPGAWQGAVVTLEQLRAAGLRGLNPPAWPHFAQALAQARGGDATALRGDPLPAGSPPEPVNSVETALTCHDFMPEQPDYYEFIKIENRLKREAPMIGWLAARVEVGRCIGITGGPSYPPHPLDAPDAPPVLLGIGNTDNYTPNLGSRHVAGQFPGGRALRHGDGHAGFVYGNSCLAGHVEAYLVDNTLPPRAATCPGELNAEIPGRPAP